MGKMQDRVTDALAAELLSRTEWDEPPALCFMYAAGGAVRLSQLALPDGVWALDRPPVILARLADGLGSFSSWLAPVAPDGLHGAAFRCEAWEIDGGKPGTRERSEAMADSWAHRIDERADRIEIRSMFAVDRAGVTYSAVQRRGESEIRKRIAYPKVGQGFAGTIPNALDGIVSAVLGVSLPARKD